MAERLLLNSLDTNDSNFFSLVTGEEVRKTAVWKQYKLRNLKPKTKYKIMVDNAPGQMFEDITDYVQPTGKSRKINTHKKGKGRWIYLKTDENGYLEFKVRPYAGGAEWSGDNNSGAVDHSSVWDNDAITTIKDEQDRKNVRIIEYSQVNNATSTDKFKEVKIAPTEVPTADTYDAKPPVTAIIDATLPAPGKDVPYFSSAKNPAPYYQTFFIDKTRVRNDDSVDITDVTLYIRRKPQKKTNLSSFEAPGINVELVECNDDGTPDVTKRFLDGYAELEWSEISASPLASSETVFTFKSPVTVKTNRFYAIAITPESDEYVFWMNTKGNLLLIDGQKTENRSSGVSKEHKGDLYYGRSFTAAKNVSGTALDSTWAPDTTKDLKFDVHVAHYNVGDVTMKLVNDDYEFLSISNTTSNWGKGETVYKDVTNAAGTLTIVAGSNKLVGTGTQFTNLVNGDKIIVTDGTDPDAVHVFTITTDVGGSGGSPASDTVAYVTEDALETLTTATYKHTVVGEVDSYDSFNKILRLNNSSVNYSQYTSNTSMSFQQGDTVIGVETGNSGYVNNIMALPITVFRCNMNGKIPANFKPSTDYKFSYLNTTSNTNVLQSEDTVMVYNAPNHVKKYKARILSRSSEVEDLTNVAYGDNYKSAVITLEYDYQGANTKTFSCPSFRVNELQLLTHQWQINNDSTNEHTNKGNAYSKYISKSLDFFNRKAEDIKVIANVYRPRNTDIEFYAKIQNRGQDTTEFDTKSWTKLTPTRGQNLYSNPDNPDSYFEMEFDFPSTIPTSETLEGVATTILNSTTVTMSGANTSQIDDLVENQVIKIYSELFPTNFGIFSIDSANSSTGEIVLNQAVSNTNIQGDGFKIDTLATPYTAFKNPLNEQIVRYFGTNGEFFDNYDTVVIKIVLLSTSNILVPKVEDYRVIGVSA